jgi:hypothetical protein
MLNGTWKNWSGRTNPWPTHTELHAEMKRRPNSMTACPVCWQWFPVTDEDSHVCPCYEVSDFRTPGDGY